MYLIFAVSPTEASYMYWLTQYECGILLVKHNGLRRSVVVRTADFTAAGSATAALFIATTWAATTA